MKLVLLQVGKTNKDYLIKGVEDFVNRVNRLANFETITITDLKNRKSMPPEEQKRKEFEKIRSMISGGDFVILLDERGNSYSSIQFSEMLSTLFSGSHKRILFVIGGPFGFHPDMSGICHRKISLSSMTFSHQLVRLLFMEQLYRGLSILKGLPYHNE